MRRIIELLVHRPVGVSTFYVLLAALASMAWVRLPVALLPSLSYPALAIWTAWPEVPPDQVERGVTIPVEQAVGGVHGVAEMTSRSQLGGSLVRLDFGWNTDLDVAATEVRQKLDSLAGHLPERVERPLVLRMDPSERPILVLALGLLDRSQPTTADLLDLKRVGEDVVARRLEQLIGVARVRVTGGHEREIRVDLAPDRLAAYGIDLLQIERALQDANVELVGGTVQKGPYRYSVEVSGQFRDAAEVAAAVVSEQGRNPVRLSDVAAVSEAVARRRGLVRLDGREVLLLLVERRPNANTVQTAAEVRDVLADLRGELPGLALDVVVDESVFVEEAIDGVLQALLCGSLLAVAVLLAFLRRPRLLAAVAVAVPLSLAITLVLFDLLGLSLNLVSLAGLALGVGLLIDNAIVVVENIARHCEEGLSPLVAAAEGAAEVAGAITASTLTTLAIFLPLTFVEGLAGRLFSDQSLAVVCSVSASLLVALTVVPLIASRDRPASSVAIARRPSLGIAFYERQLDRCLARPGRVLTMVAGFLLITGLIGLRLPREVVPETDEGRAEVRLTLPPDAGLSLLDARSRPVETALERLVDVRSVLADLGERDDARLELEPRPEYEGSLTVVLEPGTPSPAIIQLASSLSLPPDTSLEARAVETQLETLLVGGQSDLVIDLVAEPRAKAESAVLPLLGELARHPELVNVVRADPEGVPAYDLLLDRDALVRLGARADALERHLEAAARGREATRLQRVHEEVPIVLRVPAESLDVLLGERLAAGAALLPIATFVRAEPVSLPAVLVRHGQAPVVRLLADLAPGHGLAEGLGAVAAAVAATVPDGVRARLGGANQAFRQSLRAVGWSLLSSVLLVYLILAAQFESLVQPLIVLSVIPVAIGGAALSLGLTGHSWNLMSLTGSVVLVGIAVNDLILKVDFFNRRRAEIRSTETAIRQAGRERFRPIMMTTLTTVMGLSPLALGLGAGGSLRAPLAVAIVGGLLVGTFLSLGLGPVLLSCSSAPARRACSESSRRNSKAETSHPFYP